MNYFLSAFCYLFVASLLLTCRHGDVEPDPFLDGTPRLKSISFSGIPQENILIDQKSKLITVQMPSIILDKVAVTLDLTENAAWNEKGILYISPNAFGCESCFQITLKDLSGRFDNTVYTVKTLNNAPLTIALLSQPINYSISRGDDSEPRAIEIPIINLYGNPLPREARLTYDKTGEEVTIKQVPFFSTNGVYYSSNANKLAINLYDQKLQPGSYHITLIQDDNTTLKVGQPLLVTKGKLFVDYDGLAYFGYRVVSGKTLTITGFNLFEGDIHFDLLDRFDKIYPLTGVLFEKYGRQAQLTMPASLPPGQYVLRTYAKGFNEPACLRVNILKDDQAKPILGTLATKMPGDVSPCSLSETVSAQRGVALFFTSSLAKSALDKLSQHAILQLTAVSNGASYAANVVPYDMATNPEFPGSFTIPTTIPPGLYTAVLQVLDAQNKVVSESEPYGRILNVQ